MPRVDLAGLGAGAEASGGACSRVAVASVSILIRSEEDDVGSSFGSRAS